MNAAMIFETFFYDFQKEAFAFLKKTESMGGSLGDLTIYVVLMLPNQIEKLQTIKQRADFPEAGPEPLYELHDVVRQIDGNVQNLLDQVQSLPDWEEDITIASYEAVVRRFLLECRVYRRFLKDTANSHQTAHADYHPPGLEYRVAATRADDSQRRMREEVSRKVTALQEERQRADADRREREEQARNSLWGNCRKFSKQYVQVDGEDEDAPQNTDTRKGADQAARVPPPPPSYSVAQTPAEHNPPQQKKKKGFWGLFGRKKKEKQPVLPPKMDSVRFSAVAPNRVEPGKYLPIHVIMYEDSYRKTVDAMLQSYGDDSKESQSGYQQVARDTMIRVVLTSAELEIEDSVEEQRWQGNYLNFEFAAKVPADLAQEQVLLTATVYINDIIATRLKLILDRKKRPKHNLSLTRWDITSAFVSYASQDRSRVATIIQGMQAGRPDLDIFFDIESLRSGEKWEQTLRTEIAKRDVLFLCWSQNAQKSPWVDMEWRYALRTKGEESIEPIPIESPEKCPPPKELQDKHFNDKLLYVIQATAPK